VKVFCTEFHPNRSGNVECTVIKPCMPLSFETTAAIFTNLMLTRQVFAENFSQYFINIQQTVNAIAGWHGPHDKARLFYIVINVQNLVVHKLTTFF
jgi:hypothetical protein